MNVRSIWTGIHPFARVLSLSAVTIACWASDYFDSVSWSIPSTGYADEDAITAKVANSATNLLNLIIGPGFWIVMAIGSLMSLWGFARGSKDTLITGVSLFVFAAFLRATLRVVVSS